LGISGRLHRLKKKSFLLKDIGNLKNPDALKDLREILGSFGILFCPEIL
jgi:hypothetical protein